MVSDQEIASCVESLLRQPSDPAVSLTVSGLVQQAEAKLGIDLSHKAAFIRNHINLLLHHLPPPQPQFLHHLPPQHYYAASPHQIAHQSPFGNLPQRHELAFQCTPPPMLLQHQHQHQHQSIQLGGASAGSTQRQESAATPKGSQTGSKRRGGPGGLSKVCGVSPELQVIVGEPAMPRTQIVKQLWAYIRKHNLQDPNNKRKIVCNDELRLVFETDCTDMFKMNKLLAKHIIPLEPTKESGSDVKRLKATEGTVVTESESAEFSVIISDSLACFFGIEEREMLQSEALNRVWDYIRTNQLEDTSNTTVVCDAKLQQLSGCEKLSSMGVSEMVLQHFVKRSQN